MDSLTQQVDMLVRDWRRNFTSPFSPDTDVAVQDAADVLLRTGAFWFNNGILPPYEAPGNWPFHLKHLELWAVQEKAKRVGLGADDAAGYVCSTGEAHEFCIRALRQDIMRTVPTKLVALVTGESAHPGVRSAAELLGLRLICVPCDSLGAMSLGALEAALDGILDAVIVVATWRNQVGGYDNLGAISKLLSAQRERTGLPAMLHLDASRCFDQVTTLDKADRMCLGLPRLSVATEDNGVDVDEVVSVATVAAGGVNVNGMGNELVVALKPRTLGAVRGQFIECVAGNDDTISGSRDALAGAWMAMHEARFGTAGLQRIYQHSRRMHEAMTVQMIAAGMRVRFDPRGLDLIIESPLPSTLFSRWGAKRLVDGAALLDVQPWTAPADIQQLLEDLGIACGKVVCGGELRTIQLTEYPVPKNIIDQLQNSAAMWRRLSEHSCGYPGNHATLSVISPLVGHAMVASNVPKAMAWTAAHARELLDGTCAALSVDPAHVTAAFTSGSTASNRIGILTALKVLGHITLYASSAAHYGVAKIAADHDCLRNTAVVSVPIDNVGRMIPEKFAECVSRDQRAATVANRPFHAVLLATDGTTFAGATDDLPALHAAVQRRNCRIDYVHLDGALNLGASMASVTLGPPGCQFIDPITKRCVVQGISVSHHKFPGLSVAGQVLVWTHPNLPPSGVLPGQSSNYINRRAVIELWLYRQLVSEEESEALYRHCLTNARILRSRLQDADVHTLSNDKSLVTLIQRQPPWLIAQFNLSAEGFWVHFITMPHVSRGVIDDFVTAVTNNLDAVTLAFLPVRQHITDLYDIRNCDLVWQQLDGFDTDLVATVTTTYYGQHVDPTSAQIATFKSEWLDSTLCFAASSRSGNLLAVILCRVSASRTLESCCVLLHESASLPRHILEHEETHALIRLLSDSLLSHKVIVAAELAATCMVGNVFSSVEEP